jgi:hypothetical protein
VALIGVCGLLWGCDAGSAEAEAEPTEDVAVAVGVPATRPGDPLPTGIKSSCGVHALAVPGFLIADAGSGAVRSYGADGVYRRSLGAEQLDEPTDVTWGPGGDLYVADFSASAVFRFDGLTGASRGLAFLDRQVLEEPMAIRATPDVLLTLGNDSSNVAVTRPDGELQLSFGDPSMIWPLAMDVGLNHRWVYVGRSGTEGARIERYAIDGGPRSTSFGADLGLGPIRGVALGCADTLYATDGDALIRFQLNPFGGGEVLKHWDVQDAARMRLGPDGRLYLVAGDALLQLDDTDALRSVIRFSEGMQPRGVEFAAPPEEPGFGA